MLDGANRRLSNVKTRRETGLDYVMLNMDVISPFGKKALKEMRPFFPGEEDALRDELNRIDEMIGFVKENPILKDKIQEVFMEIKDSSNTISRSENSVLSVVEIYEIKSLLLQMRQLLKLTKFKEVGDYVSCHCIEQVKDSSTSDDEDSLEEEVNFLKENEKNEVHDVPEIYILEDTEDLLDELDPRKDRMNTFYIYDEFSSLLGDYRKKKREYELEIRRVQKKAREELRRQHGVQLTPKFDIVVARSHPDFEKIKALSELEEKDQDYMSVTFQLKPSEEVHKFTETMEKLNMDIESEEDRIREVLSQKISKHRDKLLKNCETIGQLELAMARGIYAINRNLSKPEIVQEHIIEYEDGRNLQVEGILKSKGKEFCPISIALKDGVTCITGANMGGKTISLKLAGQIAIMAQYGFFVPAKKAKIGLSNYMQILIGDSQSVERGLSSFGSEMEELKEILDNGRDRSVILVDEIASGTNPVEGLALTKSIVDYLMLKPYISLITTHFETVTEKEGVVNMQVIGLANADFTLLDREIKYANRRDRINIISKYMDYRLCRVEQKGEVPKDALNIAKMLGISSEIIDGAKKYIK
jgi:DNA mismatch repair protein MutS2